MSPKIIYQDYDHTYRLEDELMTSCTTFVHSFSPEFEEDYWSSYKALEFLIGVSTFKEIKKKYIPRSILMLEDLEKKVDHIEFRKHKRRFKLEWHIKNSTACKMGTRFHYEMETLSILRGTEINPFDGLTYVTRVRPKKEGMDNYSLCDNLYDLPDGFYPELLMWNEKWGIVGQADKVFIRTVEGERWIWVTDWKTNEALETSNFFENMKPPMLHRPACNMSEYELQLSLYAWMLEQFGFICKGLMIHHFTKNIELTYSPEDIERMLNYCDPDSYDDIFDGLNIDGLFDDLQVEEKFDLAELEVTPAPKVKEAEPVANPFSLILR